MSWWNHLRWVFSEGDTLEEASVEVWESNHDWDGETRPDALCAQDIGPISAGHALSVICYTPLKVIAFFKWSFLHDCNCLSTVPIPNPCQALKSQGKLLKKESKERSFFRVITWFCTNKRQQWLALAKLKSSRLKVGRNGKTTFRMVLLRFRVEPSCSFPFEIHELCHHLFPDQTVIPNPSYSSGWTDLDLTVESHLEVVHGLAAAPVLVRVLLKPLYGVNKGFIFEGTYWFLKSAVVIEAHTFHSGRHTPFILEDTHLSFWNKKKLLLFSFWRLFVPQKLPDCLPHSWFQLTHPAPWTKTEVSAEPCIITTRRRFTSTFLNLVVQELELPSAQVRTKIFTTFLLSRIQFGIFSVQLHSTQWFGPSGVEVSDNITGQNTKTKVDLDFSPGMFFRITFERSWLSGLPSVIGESPHSTSDSEKAIVGETINRAFLFQVLLAGVMCSPSARNPALEHYTCQFSFKLGRCAIFPDLTLSQSLTALCKMVSLFRWITL